MKIIDLLNKIANGEEIPKKILFFQDEFIYNEENKDWLNKEHNVGLMQYNFPYTLNNEVEIIEEDKKIQNIPLSYVVCKSDFEDMHIVDVLNNFFQANDAIINELIDKVNNMEDNK